MEEPVEALTISELLRCGRPITATAAATATSFFSSSSTTSKWDKKPQPLPPPGSSDRNRNPKVLTPFDHPAVLIGTLTLPTDNLKCPNKNCFQFSDDSSSAICCDILDFSIYAVGNRIRVLVWNFIPLRHAGGGFLEIIKWNYSDSSSVLSRCSSLGSIPLISGSSFSSTTDDKTKSCYSLHGPVESVSPVSLVSCSIGASKSYNLRGFIVQVMVCECKSCKSKDSVTVFHNLVEGQNNHSFTKPLFVYFCGSSWCWHPVITKLVGNVVTLSGLQKKSVFIGKEESQLMLVTTENSALHLPRLLKKWLPSSRKAIHGKGECGVYTGVVKGMYMQGMVVELDQEVWLLMTDQLFTAPHSLRAGSIITLWNVHFVNPNFSWTKILILGACCKTSIVVESFSPLETRCHVLSKSESQLGKFIESLTFSARLWALLLISCFRKKFVGILSEEEILGSKHNEGLVQMYASSHLPSSVFRDRHGVFTELCKHDLHGCGSESYCGNLKLVMPISMFLYHSEAMWMRIMLQLEKNHDILCGNTQFNFLSCEGKSYSQPLRRVLLSKDIGVFLLGSLKISSSSGRLQLVDATGGIDVIIPDLPSTWKTDSIYEVVNYSLTIEGTPEHVNHLKFLDKDTISCRHIFHCIPLVKRPNLKIYLCFHIRNTACKNVPIYPSVGWSDCNFEELQSGRFHLIWVSHKYPVLQKFQGNPVISDRSTMFIEAIVFPWDLFLSGKQETLNPVKVLEDWLDKSFRYYPEENYQEDMPNKKRKIIQASGQAFASNLMDDLSNNSSSFSSSLMGSTEWKSGNMRSLLEISCFATVRTANSQNLVSSGKLFCTDYKVKKGGDCKPSAEKVLLEFNTESYFKYQIGSYYIIKHHTEESFCGIKDCDNVSSGKVIITSRIHLWSLSFCSDENVTNKSSDYPSNGPLGSEEVPTCKSPESCSDVYLHLPADVMDLLEEKLNETKESLTKPAMKREILNRSSHTCTMKFEFGASSGSVDSSCLFPQGNLVSVLGHVVAIHGFDSDSANVHSSCESLDDILRMRFFQGITKSFCIHVLMGNQMVFIFGSLSKHACPVGLGPGVKAIFHRVLKLRKPNRLMLTPVSFIVINSVEVANESCAENSPKFCKASYTSTAGSLNNVSSGMISEYDQLTDFKTMRFNCRVVALHVLVLEKNRKYKNLHPEDHSTQQFVDIPLAGFVLDDGSSSWCCWANAERAKALLQLHDELPERALENSGCTIKWVGIDKSFWKKSMFHLEQILKKHDRITVKNCGSMVDSSYQDLTISFGSDNTLSSSDENILKFIIFNACFGTCWTVVARTMHSNAVRQLEKDHPLPMEARALPMQNIWAVEVSHLDTLAEARGLMQEFDID